MQHVPIEMKRAAGKTLYDDLPYKDLQTKCRERGLNARGRASELVARLEDDDEVQEPIISDEDGDPQSCTVTLAGSNHMEHMLTSAVYSDVRFMVGAERMVIPAHRCLLAVHSEVCPCST